MMRRPGYDNVIFLSIDGQILQLRSSELHRPSMVQLQLNDLTSKRISALLLRGRLQTIFFPK